jgi:hypothetical protein
VVQQQFDRLLKSQLQGYSKEDIAKARTIALPIAYAALEER